MIFIGILLLITVLATVATILIQSIGKGKLPGNTRLLCDAWNSITSKNSSAQHDDPPA